MRQLPLERLWLRIALTGLGFAHIEGQERDAVPKLVGESLERRASARGHGSGDGTEGQQQRAPTDNVAFADAAPICRLQIEVCQEMAGATPP
jgi:hypothetical protein